MQPGTKVYVSWYGRTLEGEVAGSDGFMGMTPVRIPLDGHHPVALFMPQHVYDGLCDSPEKLTEISVDRSKVAESLTEIFEKQSKVDTDVLECFKESHWDEAHNHLRTDSLEEFYQLWRKTHDRRQPENGRKKAVKCNSCQYWVFSETLGSLDKPIWHCRDGFSPSADCQDEAAYNDECMRRDPKQRPSSKPVPVQPVPQNGTPSNTKQLHKTKPAKAVELSLFD